MTDKSFPIGSSVLLQNLVNAAKYNGMKGIVQSDVDSTTFRQNVFIVDANKVVAMKPANLKALTSEQGNTSTNGKKRASSNSTAAQGKGSKKSKTYADLKWPKDDSDLLKGSKSTISGQCANCDRNFFGTASKGSNGPFSCLKCGDKFCGKCESNTVHPTYQDWKDFSCCFCEKGLCPKCRDYDERMLRCDLCCKVSCNSLGDGNKKCPKFVPDEYYDGLPLCNNCSNW